MSALDLTATDVEPDDDEAPAVTPLWWSPATVPWWVVVLFLAAHVVLGLASDLNPPPLATLHAVTTLVVAVWLVGVRRNVEAVACIAGYIAASDVLWRMTGAAVPWEIAKISLTLVFGAAIIRMIRRPRRIGLPITVLLLLIPSAVVTVERFGLVSAGRERLTFDIGAYGVLVLGVIFFSNLKAPRQVFAGVLWMVLAPTLTVNTIATAGTIGLHADDFSSGLSNAASSGGYGPNQVSALIGVGALLSVFLVFLDKRPVMRFLAGGLAIWFLAQSALTFSRGGSLNLLVALVAVSPFYFRTAQTAVRFLAVGAAVALVIAFAVIPVIQNITGDQFGQRFTSADPTLRTDIMRQELDTWSHNFALGIGVGMMERHIEDVGAAERGQIPRVSAHTEYTRLLAEHGLLGLAVILALLAIAIRSARSQVLFDGRIMSIALSAWAASELAHAATRLSLVPYLFALAALTIVPGAAPPRGRLFSSFEQPLELPEVARD
jgi:hypothetical protein